MNTLETAQLLNLISDNPLLTFLLVFLTIYLVIRSLLLAWGRFMRHLNIRAQGWPPPHLDADGDAVVTSTDDDEPA